VTIAEFRNLLWDLAILIGWFAAIPHGLAWVARRKFRAFLKLPLTEDVENMTHRWERHAARWTAIGLWMSGFSVLCLIVWVISGMLR
jgi:hypothetical protein